jgi:hypothetical protein
LIDNPPVCATCKIAPPKISVTVSLSILPSNL